MSWWPFSRTHAAIEVPRRDEIHELKNELTKAVAGHSRAARTARADLVGRKALVDEVLMVFGDEGMK